MAKTITLLFAALSIAIFSFGTQAIPMSCNTLFAADGGIANLDSSTPCVVNDEDNFNWTASDGSVNTFVYDYDVTLGSENLEDVANVIGFLTDFGITNLAANSVDFLDNSHSVVGSLSLLGKSDEGYGDGADTNAKSGDWEINDPATFMTVKAANSFLLYFLDPAATSGDWSTLGIENNGGNQPNLSHISWWATDTGFVTTSCTDCVDIPEPRTVLIFAFGMFLLLGRKLITVKD
jgi:hypothetical protein